MVLVSFSGDMDKLFAVLSIATAAASMGIEVSIFSTFWGISALRRKRTYRGKSVLQRAMNFLLPSRAGRLPLSRRNLFGAGPVFFRHLMKTQRVPDVEELVRVAQEAGVRFIVCAMSMSLMGLTQEELVDGIEMGGAATCVNAMAKSKSSLFI